MFPRRWDPRPRGMFPRRPGRPPAPAECFPVPRIWVTAPTGKHSHNVSPLLAQQRRGNIPGQPRRGNILSRSGRRGNIPAPGHSTRATGEHSWGNGRGCCPGGLVGGPGGNVSPSGGLRKNVSTTSRQANGETLCVPSTGKHSGNRADGETFRWLVKCFPVAGIALPHPGYAVALLLLLLLLASPWSAVFRKTFRRVAVLPLNVSPSPLSKKLGKSRSNVSTGRVFHESGPVETVLYVETFEKVYPWKRFPGPYPWKRFGAPCPAVRGRKNVSTCRLFAVAGHFFAYYYARRENVSTGR